MTPVNRFNNSNGFNDDFVDHGIQIFLHLILPMEWDSLETATDKVDGGD